ncbi:MAG: MFS transporter [Gammaproteobacteria bacterium]|nr:MFS transporter [Gammaproteobacteria bacterium]
MTGNSRHRAPDAADDRNERVENLYARIVGDEDARVCKDIPDAACNDQPFNFFAYLGSNALGKIADEIASAKLLIPWLFGTLGVPATFTGFLVPIREAGVLIPQLVVAALVRAMPVRKGVWLLGAALSATALLGMAVAAATVEGMAAGFAILGLLVVYSLARGLCSVSAKDVLGKTISKSRRGRLMGLSASISGLVVLTIGIWLAAFTSSGTVATFSILFAAAGVCWIVAALVFGAIREQPGATEGGGNALAVAVQQLGLLRTEPGFRRYVVARALLLSVALAPPFYVLVAQQQADSGLLGLGTLIVANGLATSLSAPVWGYLGDWSSKKVMASAAAGAGIVGVLPALAAWQDWGLSGGGLGMAPLFFVVTVMHGGVRLGRKVYLVDMSDDRHRAAFVAVSNTAIGVLMLVGGLVGLVGDWLGPAAVILALAAVSFVAAAYAMRLPDVSGSAQSR